MTDTLHTIEADAAEPEQPAQETALAKFALEHVAKFNALGKIVGGVLIAVAEDDEVHFAAFGLMPSGVSNLLDDVAAHHRKIAPSDEEFTAQIKAAEQTH